MTASRLTIAEAQIWHCGLVARRMRRAHIEGFDRAGTFPHRELRAIFNLSAFRKVATLDGQIIAMGGVSGTLATSIGFIWLALTEEATKHPVSLMREAKNQVQALMRTHGRLETMVLEDDDAAMRFAVRLGFRCWEESPVVLGRTQAIPLSYGARA